MSLLGIGQLLEYAVQVEEKGELFFREWAGKAASDDLKKIFELLAEEESIHKKTFENLKDGIGDDSADGVVPGEYDDYLRLFTEEILFAHEEAKAAAGLHDAVELAKKQELNSILFYSEMRTYLPKGHDGVIKKIIDEERKHYVKLSSLEKKLI